MQLMNYMIGVILMAINIPKIDIPKFDFPKNKNIDYHYLYIQIYQY